LAVVQGRDLVPDIGGNAVGDLASAGRDFLGDSTRVLRTVGQLAVDTIWTILIADAVTGQQVLVPKNRLPTKLQAEIIHQEFR
jgi:hypothetical protein